MQILFTPVKIYVPLMDMIAGAYFALNIKIKNIKKNIKKGGLQVMSGLNGNF